MYNFSKSYRLECNIIIVETSHTNNLEILHRNRLLLLLYKYKKRLINKLVHYFSTY